MSALAPRSTEALAALKALPGAAEPPTRGLRFEFLAFLLIVATFAAVLLKDAVIDTRFAIGPDTVSRYSRYWFSDGNTTGTSSAAEDATDPLKWRCNLTQTFANRYCGFGILMDIGHRGAGRDFSRFEKLVIDLDYSGPSDRLKVSLKNWGAPYADAIHGDSAKPNVIEFHVVQGHNQVELNLRDAAVEQWWIVAHPFKDAGKPEIKNIVAMDIQTGTGAVPGLHIFRLNNIAVTGAAISPEHWYLILLGCWTGFTALYLVHRMRRMRQEYVARQRWLLAESRLLQEARDAAESASQAKSRFLAHMSHELRTPLNAILGYAQILRVAELSNRQNVAARTIQQSGEHLLALISDILDLSKIEAGKLELAPRPIELRAIVRSVADMVAVRAQEKGLSFQWQVAPDVPHCLIVDDKALRQILLNLLGNAVKFTPAGEVSLAVSRVGEDSPRERLRFEVRDTGPGIPAGRTEAIFEPFEQGDSQARRAGGTGLGLSISRRIVELMEGQLRLESTEGEGSLFWFEIVVPVGDQAALPPRAANDRGAIGAFPPPMPAFPAVPEAVCMARLLDLARAGNMRALRAEAEAMIADHPALHAFGAHLLELARDYQSRAIRELIERYRAESAVG